MNTDETIAACERMFAPWLDGHPLLTNMRAPARLAVAATSRSCATRRGTTTNIVLIGDAAHTAHFSIGSGTKLAMEDAIALARALNERRGADADSTRSTGPARSTRAQRYQDERSTEALRLQNAARNSMEWFENVRRYIHLEPEQFAYSLLTRSQRVSHENLRLRDRAYLDGVERWFARACGNREAGTGTGSCEQRAAPVPDSRSRFRAASRQCSRRTAARADAAEPHRRVADGHVLAPPTACLTISISCTSAPARSAGRGWCSPR